MNKNQNKGPIIYPCWFLVIALKLLGGLSSYLLGNLGYDYPHLYNNTKKKNFPTWRSSFFGSDTQVIWQVFSAHEILIVDF